MTAHWPQAIAEFIGAFGHMLFAPLSGVCVIRLFTRRCAYLSNAERRRLIYLFTQPQSAQRASGGSPSPSPHLLYLTWEARHMWPAHAVKGSSGEGHSTSLRPLDLWPASSSPRVTTQLIVLPPCTLPQFHSHLHWQLRMGNCVVVASLTVAIATSARDAHMQIVSYFRY